MLKYINENTNTLDEYGYACARIRELEKNLLNNEIIIKMIESSGIDNSLKILAENDFSEYSPEFKNDFNFEQILREILKKTIDVITEISPYPLLPQLFRLEYDFNNLKILLKANVLETQYSYPLYDFGNIKTNDIKSAVLEGKYQSIPIKMERIIRQSTSEFIKSNNLQLMEAILDHGYYEMLFDILEEINHPFLYYFYKSSIDLLNFAIICRCKIRNVKKSRLPDYLLKTGYLSIQKFINIYGNSMHSWSNNFQKTEYNQIIENGMKYWLEENSLLEFERLSDNYLLSLLNIGKYTTFGLESIIGYYYAKRNDLKNIRIIFNSKKYNFPIEIIKGSVRNTYV